MENLIVRSWTKRKATKAMRRLRAILEDGSERGARASYRGGVAADAWPGVALDMLPRP